MQKIILFSLILMSIVHVNKVSADPIPYFAVNQEINFGSTLFVPGNCTMSHVNGSFSSATPDQMCGAGGNAVPGRYVIVADPNQQVSIEFKQRNNQGDGLMFIPEGEFISDVETVAIVADTAQEIDSGASGIINIHVGGRLFLLTNQSPGSAIGFTYVNGVEWSIVP